MLINRLLCFELTAFRSFKLQNIWDLSIHQKDWEDKLEEKGRKREVQEILAVLFLIRQTSTTGLDGCQEEKNKRNKRKKKSKSIMSMFPPHLGTLGSHCALL